MFPDTARSTFWSVPTRSGAKPVQITEARGPSIVVCRLHKLTLPDQAQVTTQLTIFPIQCKDF